MLQAIVNHENKGRAGRRPGTSDAAAAIEPPQPILPPDGHALAEKSASHARSTQRHGLHPRLDGVGGEEEEVVGHARRGAGHGLLPEGQRRLHYGLLLGFRGGDGCLELVEHAAHGLLGAEPRGAAAALPDERAELPVPEAAEALVAEDVPDDAEGLERGGGVGAVGGGRLDLALDQLDRGQDEAGADAGEGAGGPEGGQGEAALARGQAGGVEGLAADALEEEEAAGLDGGADERRADAAVQAEEAVGPDGLAEAVQRAGVSEGQVVGLALEPHLDGVEGVLYVFADDTGDLLFLGNLLSANMRACGNLRG